jgi:hypothetical protein
MAKAADIVNSVEESKWLNTRSFPMVIISASGDGNRRQGSASLCALLHPSRGTPFYSPDFRPPEPVEPPCWPVPAR